MTRMRDPDGAEVRVEQVGPRRLRVELQGGSAELGQVAAADVARLMLGVERILAHAAARVINQRIRTTGRWKRVVEDAARIRLVSVERGSVAPVFDLPAWIIPDGAIAFADAETLTSQALTTSMATLAGQVDDADIARVALELADEVGLGTRSDAITFRADPGTPSERVARIDGPSRVRLLEIVKAAERRRGEVTGRLFEADFERRTAKLRLVTGQVVTVSFTPELEDGIYSVLRGMTAMRGDVTYAPDTAVARRIEVTRLDLPEQLTVGLELGDFWSTATLDELASEQGAPKVTDLAALVDHEATDEEVEAFLQAIA